MSSKNTLRHIFMYSIYLSLILISNAFAQNFSYFLHSTSSACIITYSQHSGYSTKSSATGIASNAFSVIK